MTVQGANNTGQWLGDLALPLEAGSHAVEVRVPSGTPKRGDGASVAVSVALVADEPGRLQTLPVPRWRSLRGRKLDWIELVRLAGRREAGPRG